MWSLCNRISFPRWRFDCDFLTIKPLFTLLNKEGPRAGALLFRMRVSPPSASPSLRALLLLQTWTEMRFTEKRSAPKSHPTTGCAFPFKITLTVSCPACCSFLLNNPWLLWIKSSSGARHLLGQITPPILFFTDCQAAIMLIKFSEGSASFS